MSEGAPGTTLSTEDLEVLKKAALELAERASALDDGAHAVRAVREAYERAFPLMEDYASALVDKDINAPEVMPAFRWLEKARRYLKENPPPVVDAELSKSEGSAAPEADDEWEGFLLRGETKGRPILPAPHNARVMLLHHPDLKNKLVWNTVTNTVDVRGGALAPYATKDLDTLISALMDYFTAVHGFSISRDELGRRLGILMFLVALREHIFLLGGQQRKLANFRQIAVEAGFTAQRRNRGDIAPIGHVTIPSLYMRARRTRKWHPLAAQTCQNLYVKLA